MLGIFLISAFSYTTVAQKLETTKILTSAYCGSCKTRIEKSVAYEKGVKDLNLELESKILTVEYKSGKTSPEKLCAAVKKLGYEASVIKDDKAAASHKCPKKGVECSHKKDVECNHKKECEGKK